MTVGFLTGMTLPGGSMSYSYSKDFVDVNISKTMGIDHCYNPTKKYSKTTKATSASFGGQIGFGVGYDYYSDPYIFAQWRFEME